MTEPLLTQDTAAESSWISYSDTGAGPLEDFNLDGNDSLRMVIITSLIDQLEGTLTIEKGPEKAFIMNIPL